MKSERHEKKVVFIERELANGTKLTVPMWEEFIEALGEEALEEQLNRVVDGYNASLEGYLMRESDPSYDFEDSGPPVRGYDDRG